MQVSFAQDANDFVFNKFLSYFERDYYRHIPKDFFLENYNSICNDDMIAEIDAREKLELDTTIICFIEISYPWDAAVYDYYYIFFSKSGRIRESKKFAYTSLMGTEKGIFASYGIFADSVLQVYKDQFGIMKSYEQFIISEKGMERYFNFNYPSKGRKYPYTTERLITKAELEKLSKSDLSLMRNEIFADHGYIFKSKKWQTYFIKQTWYNPRYENVNDSLTMFEKINIQTILKAEESK